jgi:hypothetical protein
LDFGWNDQGLRGEGLPKMVGLDWLEMATGDRFVQPAEGWWWCVVVLVDFLCKMKIQLNVLSPQIWNAIKCF